jgi:hypothetical protein
MLFDLLVNWIVDVLEAVSKLDLRRKFITKIGLIVIREKKKNLAGRYHTRKSVFGRRQVDREIVFKIKVYKVI